MSKEKSKNDTAWEALFAERDILGNIDKNGFYRITATEINKKREARLMTKLDYFASLPDVFKQNNLSILPDSRSSYIIGRFDCYQKINSQDIRDIPIERAFPEWMRSLSPDNLYSEASALLCAQYAGLIADVLEEEVSFTVFGRMSTGKFSFSINTLNRDIYTKQSFTVDRAQCEIDGGFEGPESFAIVEVKNQEVEDFHIRQLYYPFRLWQSKISKRVVPIFLTYSNEIFTFSVYQFEDENDYNSLRLVKRKRYQIVPTEIEIADIRGILAQAKVQSEVKGIPFPQADRFERVIDLLIRLYSEGGTLTKEEITTNYGFVPRQTLYYTTAGRYLGLIKRSEDLERGVCYSLTQQGMQLMNKAPRARNLALVELILAKSVFRTAMNYYLDNSSRPNQTEVLKMIKTAKLSMSDVTGMRRARTVLAWIGWVIKLTAEG